MRDALSLIRRLLLALACLCAASQGMAATPRYTLTQLVSAEPSVVVGGLQVQGLLEDGRVYGKLLHNDTPDWNGFLGARPEDLAWFGGTSFLEVNERGHAVFGQQEGALVVRAAFFDGAQSRPIGPGDYLTLSASMNDLDQVVGTSYLRPGDPSVAWLYADGHTSYLDGLGSALLIDNQGDIYGLSSQAGHEGELALWRNGQLSYGVTLPSPHEPTLPSLADINTWIDPVDGYRITRLVDVNGHGQIAGELCADIGGTCWAVRLDPVAAVPEPATLLLMAGGLAALAGLRRRSASGG